MKTKHQTRHLDAFHPVRSRRRMVLSSPSTWLQEIAYNDGRAEKKGTAPTVRERIPGWTDEEMLGLAVLLAEDETERENYSLHHRARSRSHDFLEV